MKKILGIVLSGCLLFSACGDDDDDKTTKTCPPPGSESSLTVQFKATVGNDELQLNQVYDDYAGRKFQVELLKLYISQFTIRDADGNKTMIKDISFINFNDNAVSLKATVASGNYIGLDFGIGVDSILNESDPATFPDTHPLAAINNTYWSWAAKYKFVQLEGKADLNGDDALEQVYGYHTGLNPLYRTKTINHSFEIQAGQNTNLTLAFDINEMFSLVDTVDYATESSWHGNAATVSIAERLTDNFVASLHVE